MSKKQNQVNLTKKLHDALTIIQSEIPGKYYTDMENIKRSVVQLNSELAAEVQVEAKKCAKEECPNNGVATPNCNAEGCPNNGVATPNCNAEGCPNKSNNGVADPAFADA